MILRFLAVSVMGLTLSLGAPARAQEEQATTVDEIVVTARRTDAPIWEVTRGDSTLILVGHDGGASIHYLEHMLAEKKEVERK